MVFMYVTMGNLGVTALAESALTPLVAIRLRYRKVASSRPVESTIQFLRILGVLLTEMCYILTKGYYIEGLLFNF